MPFFNKSKSSPPPLRIADVLLLQDHQEESLLLNLMDGCRRLNCSTPRGNIAARLLSALKRWKVKRIIVDNDNNGERQKQDDDDDVAPTYATGGPGSSSERCRREADCCLLHLIDESKNELQKMRDLRIQMEIVLQNVQEGLPNIDLLAALKLESSDGVDDHVPNEEEEDCLDGMDRLEAELEVELERFQLHLDTVKLSTNPPHEAVEESPVYSSVSTRSYSISSGEVIDPTIDDGGEEEEEDYSDSYYGVPPNELERKLHELLETRQEQQIRELQVALESARQELVEKEREIFWWKDTALLIARHVKDESTCSPLDEVREVRTYDSAYESSS